MKKRRIEIAVLAALVLFAGIERPSLAVRLPHYQVGDFVPQRVATIRDLGVIAVKLLVDRID